ncbi:MAG: YpsA SLOG family protein [Chthoniobacterales bacterium]
MKIISGGQTGVDRAALDAALSLGIESGGWCPAGRLDENGRIPDQYPVRELPNGGFPERTLQNVLDSDATIIIHPGSLHGGTADTARICDQKRKPFMLIDASITTAEDAAHEIGRFVHTHHVRVLNVAGPRASEWWDGYAFVVETITTFLNEISAPKISFIVPAHNEEHELPQSLRALRAAADESRKTYELIVVDDQSTDATAGIAQQFGARIVRVNLRQIAAVRNAGARAARGKILFFVDADTQIDAMHIRAALEAIENGCVGGSARVALDRPVPLWARIFLIVFSATYFTMGLGVGAFIFTRREHFETIGGFDEQYFAGEEVYLSLALRKLGRFIILRHPITTSARKITMHSTGYWFRQWGAVLFGGRRVLTARDRLHLWYDGKRERRSA